MTLALWRSATEPKAPWQRAMIGAVVTMCMVISGCGSSGKAATSNPGTARPAPSTIEPGARSEPTPSPPAGPISPSTRTPPGRTYLPLDKYGSTSELPRAVGPAKSTPEVTVFQLDAATEAGLVGAFDTYKILPATCISETIPGTIYLATVKVLGYRISGRGEASRG